VYILSLNGCVKFQSKICMHCWNINRNWRERFFTRPVQPCAQTTQPCGCWTK